MPPLHPQDWTYLLAALQDEQSRRGFIRGWPARGVICIQDAGIRDSLIRAGLMMAALPLGPWLPRHKYARLTVAGRKRAEQIQASAARALETAARPVPRASPHRVLS